MSQAYSYLTPSIINKLPLSEFHLMVHCMYNYMAMQQGVDPENPTNTTSAADTSSGENTRKVAGAEAAALLMHLSKIKSESKGDTT